MELKPFDCPIAPDRPPTPVPVAELSERITRTLVESRRVIDATQVVLVRGWALLDRYRGPSMSAVARGDHHD